MTRLYSLFVVTVLSGCTAEPLDVQGTWNLQLTTGATGTCFNPNQVINTTVATTLEDDTYKFAPANPQPGDTIAGSFECREDECDFDLTVGEVATTQQGNVTFTTVLEIHINDALAISGTGNVTGVGAINCTHPVTVGGTVQ
jgi:hypothetical protein